MAVQAKVGSFSTGTALNTATDITCGFQPKAVFLWMNGRTEGTDTAARGDIDWSFGFGTQTERACQSMSDDDGAGSQAGRQSYREDCIIESQSPSASTGLLDLDAFANWPSDGFRVIIDSAFTTARRVAFMAIGGADITDVDIVRFSTPGVAGNYDVTTLSFQPDFLMLLSHGPQADPPTSATTACVGTLGWATATDQATFGMGTDPGSASADTGAYLRSDEIFGRLNVADPTIVQVRHAFVQFLSNGFTLNGIDIQNLTRISALAIKGGVWTVGSFSQSGSTILSSSVSTGMTPKALMVFSANRSESVVDTGTSPLSVSIGAATGPSERVALAHYSEDGSANMRAQTIIEHDAVVIEPGALGADGTAGNVGGLQDITSFDSSGFQYIADDTPSSGWYCSYFAVGDPVFVLPPPIRCVRRKATRAQTQRLI